jgi:hypothetical protein
VYVAREMAKIARIEKTVFLIVVSSIVSAQGGLLLSPCRWLLRVRPRAILVSDRLRRDVVVPKHC